jgi:hypothetical protein
MSGRPEHPARRNTAKLKGLSSETPRLDPVSDLTLVRHYIPPSEFVGGVSLREIGVQVKGSRDCLDNVGNPCEFFKRV